MGIRILLCFANLFLCLFQSIYLFCGWAVTLHFFFNMHVVWMSERQRLRVRGFGIDSVSFDVVDCVLSFSWSYFFVCTFNFYFFCVEIFYVVSRCWIELKLLQRITYFYSDNYIFAINLFLTSDLMSPCTR